jgi:hypothetical protein
MLRRRNIAEKPGMECRACPVFGQESAEETRFLRGNISDSQGGGTAHA